MPWRRKWLPAPYSCQENLIDRGVSQATVHEVAKRVGHDIATKQIHYKQNLIEVGVVGTKAVSTLSSNLRPAHGLGPGALSAGWGATWTWG